ncbi:MAG TPA: PIN domain-containing protein [Bryobacteraceae bacterium]|jgi:predicted nucleic acid-binding protein
MKGDRIFFDTNMLIYAYSEAGPRTKIAEALLARGGVVGVQVLNEFVSVARRKLGMRWETILEVLRSIRVLCPSPAPVTFETHEKALQIARRYGYRIYDAVVIASALEASCNTLYTEDLHDGQVIEGLTIRNPFPRSNGAL